MEQRRCPHLLPSQSFWDSLKLIVLTAALLGAIYFLKFLLLLFKQLKNYLWTNSPLYFKFLCFRDLEADLLSKATLGSPVPLYWSVNEEAMRPWKVSRWVPDEIPVWVIVTAPNLCPPNHGALTCACTWPWINYLTCLHLSFLSSKAEIRRVVVEWRSKWQS